MSDRPEFRNRAAISDEQATLVQGEVQRHETLQSVLTWCAASHPPRQPCASHAQDEFSHDVVVPYAEGLFLAYAVT